MHIPISLALEQLDLPVSHADADWVEYLDIIDTNPDTILNPYPQDPTPLQILTYTGVATEVPYQNSNPQPGCAGNDVRQQILVVFYQMNEKALWNPANPGDGIYNEAMETYTSQATIPIPHVTTSH